MRSTIEVRDITDHLGVRTLATDPGPTGFGAYAKRWATLDGSGRWTLHTEHGRSNIRITSEADAVLWIAEGRLP